MRLILNSNFYRCKRIKISKRIWSNIRKMLSNNLMEMIDLISMKLEKINKK